MDIQTSPLPDGADPNVAIDVYNSILEDNRVQVTSSAVLTGNADGEPVLQYGIDAADLEDAMWAFRMANNQLEARMRYEQIVNSIDESIASRKKTVVVNMFGGPGAGKTTAAFEFLEKLSKAGYVVEYAPEYAKELVWMKDNTAAEPALRALAASLLDGKYEHQMQIYDNQLKRIQRLAGQCDFVVTDSPILLSALYLKPDYQSQLETLKNRALKDFGEFENFNIFVKRSGDYQQAGRVHDEEQAREIDARVVGFLKENDIYYGTYDHDSIELAIKNAMKTHERVTGEPAHAIESPEENVKTQAKGKTMAYEYVNVSIPKTGYKDKESVRAIKVNGQEVLRVELPPHTPPVKIDGKDVDLSYYSFLVPFNAVAEFENDKEYYSVGFPKVNHEGKEWEINLRKDQGHWENPEGETRAQKGEWINDEPIYATVKPQQLKESMEQYRENIREYRANTRNTISRPFMKEQQQDVAREAPKARRGAHVTEKKAPVAEAKSVSKDAAQAKTAAKAQSAAAKTKEQVKNQVQSQ